LLAGRRWQDQLIPVQLGLDPPRRKIAVETRFPFRAYGELAETLVRQGERAAQRGFVRTGPSEAQKAAARKNLVFLEQRHELETRGQVVAGQDEQRGLTGRDEPAVGIALQPA